MALMRRGKLFAGVLFAGLLFGPQAQEAGAEIPAFDAPAAFSAPRPRAYVITLRAAGLALEAERARGSATQVHLLAARCNEAEHASARAQLIQSASALAADPGGAAQARAASRLDTARAAALNNQALSAGLL